jgi:hypothetical protein
MATKRRLTRDTGVRGGARAFLEEHRDRIVPEGMFVVFSVTLYWAEWSRCVLCGRRRPDQNDRAMGYFCRRQDGGREIKRAVCEECYRQPKVPPDE